VLSRAVPQRMERQRVNRALVLVMGRSRAAADCYGFGVFVHRAQNITQQTKGKSEL
jgi:hypothetical protein